MFSYCSIDETALSRLIFNNKIFLIDFIPSVFAQTLIQNKRKKTIFSE